MTADVHVYEILWTAQVTQKSKVWYDGTLKLHTFNKRAMLYDTSRVLIDSTFLSKSALRLGDTLVMERHLVTIENQSSTYAVDVSSVIRTARLSQKKINSAISPANWPSGSRLQSSSAPPARESGSSSNDFNVRLSHNSLSKGAVPKGQPIPQGDPFRICAETSSPRSTSMASPLQESQYHAPLLTAECSTPQTHSLNSHFPRVKSPGVMEPPKINQSMPRGRAKSQSKFGPTSDNVHKVHTPYRSPMSVLGSKSPNIDPSSLSSNRTAIHSTLDVMDRRPMQVPPPVRVYVKANDGFKGSLLTPPNTSSPVKSSVVGDDDIHDDYGCDESVVDNDMTKRLSLNCHRGMIAGVQESSQLVLQQAYQEGQVFRALPGRPTLPTLPSESGSRFIDSLPGPKESAEVGGGNNRFLNRQLNHCKQVRPMEVSEQRNGRNDVTDQAKPQEGCGVIDDGERLGPVPFNELRSSHSPSLGFSSMCQIDDGSRRPRFSGTNTLETAELTLTQSEPTKRRLLSVARKSSRRKIVR
ncbi:hypothetical protein V1525DRAFT_366255 [Lipomyces kononenkoae]|uniref:Uncharacterized protein n=1 Tax=Lipomyces kononenkoae TaxID=34357 RepID=A0ACC3SU30_LIPKO